MATWFTYLRVSEKIKATIDGIELPYLMLGFTAPFLNDKNDDKDLEFKDISNFFKEITDNKGNDLKNKIITFKKSHIDSPYIIYKSDNKRSFLWGYYFGLLLIRKWINDFPKISDMEGILQGNDIYDFDYLSKNGHEMIDTFYHAEIAMTKCNDFDAIQLNQYRNRIYKYYNTNRSIIKLDDIKEFDPKLIENFINESANLCLNIMMGKNV